MAMSQQVVNPLTGQVISEKLNKGNHVLWKMQVLVVIRGVGLEGYLTGKSSARTATIPSKDSDGKEREVAKLAYEAWSLIDQRVTGFLLSIMGKESLSQVRVCCTTAKTWAVIEGNFTSATRVHTVNSRITLATTKKGDFSIVDYINNMCVMGGELAVASKPIDDNVLISYILTGLDFEYNSVITTLIAKEKLTLGEVYSQLLSFEQRLELQRSTEHYVNVASRGRGNPRGRALDEEDVVPQGRSGPPRPDNRPKCQLCGRKGHIVLECWHRFDESYVPRSMQGRQHPMVSTPIGTWTREQLTTSRAS
jgi:hypothetical protein